MAGRKNGLGRGLDAFFPDRASVVKEPARKTTTKTVKTEKKCDVAEKQTNPTVAKKQTADSKTGAMIVKISSVEPNMDQPRKQFDEDALMELSESIKQYGVLHPLLVSDKKDYYEIIAGERRWRAAKLAGLTEIPVIVKEFSEQELVEISLIENIQREDLNPVEEAMAYKRLIDEFHLKQDEIAEKEHRKRMVQFAIDKIPYFKISNIEYKRAGKTYTYDTLVELKKEREDAHFYFIMGGDSLAQFEQWYHPEKIVKLCTILAASRDEISYEQTKEYCKQLSERLDGDFRPLKIPAMSISSHEIRKRIKKGKSIIGYCPEPVVRYIQMHRLYGDSSFVIPKNEKEQMDCLAASLRPKRFVHTLGVANMAANLAMMHDDVSLQRAKLAGLLHDCAKYLTNEEMFVLCEKLEIPLSESEKSTPAVIHGKLGAKLAVLRYGIEDDEICSAIACHTTGKSQMTTLEKIIYIADYIEPNRDMDCKPYPLERIRRTAFFDLNQATGMILKNTLTYLEENQMPIDEMSLEAFHYYFTIK